MRHGERFGFAKRMVVCVGVRLIRAGEIVGRVGLAHVRVDLVIAAAVNAQRERRAVGRFDVQLLAGLEGVYLTRCGAVYAKVDDDHYGQGYVERNERREY